MRILVIGGSYFLGRWFVQHAYGKHEITVLNRGNIPIRLDGVTELKADRHNDSELCKLDQPETIFDAVVDFCAYGEGDIRLILKHLCTPPERYIYLSTVDVYKKDAEAGTFGNEAEYIRGKAALEDELLTECTSRNIKGVSVRPVIVYGPGNYAPRESIYLEWIKKAGQIIHPVDSDGYFQMIYVSDAALGILRLCELPKEELEDSYDFCTDEVVTYASFETALSEALRLHEQKGSDEQMFTKVDVTVDMVIKQGIPLPFPLTRAGSSAYPGDRFKKLGIKITPLRDGLLECIKVF